MIRPGDSIAPVMKRSRKKMKEALVKQRGPGFSAFSRRKTKESLSGFGGEHRLVLH